MLIGKKLKTIFYLLLVLTYTASCEIQKFKLKEGDILFQDLDKYTLSNVRILEGGIVTDKEDMTTVADEVEEMKQEILKSTKILSLGDHNVKIAKLNK